MLVINGVNVFPSQIEHVLAKIDDITLNYQIIANKKGHLDKLDIDVELNENCMSDDVGELTNLQKHIQHELLSALYINVTIHLVAPKSLKRSEGKAVRVIDKRK